MSKMTKAQAGAIGARKRWGPRRTVRLTDLDPITREMVERILQAGANAQRDREAADAAEAA